MQTRIICQVVGLLAAILWMPINPATADLVLNGFGTINWDRTNQLSGSQSVTIGTTSNSNVNTPNTINSFNVGLMFVPFVGATGSLTDGTLMIANSNSVFAAFNPLSANNINMTVRAINGTNAATVPTVNGFQPANVTVNGTANLFSLNFISPLSDAAGTFQVFAVPEFTSYFYVDEFDGSRFANVPNGPNVLLGTINVSVTAVPEPSSAILVGSILVAAVARARRRKRLS